MSTVLRDVTVRVGVANGNTKLGPLDISSFIKSMETACAAAEALEKQLAGIKMPVITPMTPGSSGASPGPGSMNEIPAAAAGLGQAFKVLEAQAKGLADVFADLYLDVRDSKGRGGGRRGNTGTATDAAGWDGAHGAAAGDLDEFFQRHGATRPAAAVQQAAEKLTPEERRMTKMAGRLQRKHLNMKQEVSDNDVANAVKATNKSKAEDAANAKKQAEDAAAATARAEAAEKAYAQSSRAAAAGAVEFAKGLALVALSGDKNNESLARGIVQAQGYFNLISGGLSAMHSFGDMLKANAARGGQSGQNKQGPGTPGAGDVPALSQLMSGNLIAAAVALTAAALLFKRSMNQWAVEDSKHASQVKQDFSAINLREANASYGRHIDQRIRETNNMQNFGALQQTHKNIVRRGETEKQIQADQSASTRDYGARQEMRARAEHAQSLQENTDSARNDLAHVNRKFDVHLKRNDEDEADRAKSEKAHEEHLKELKAGFREHTGVSREEGILTKKESDNDVDIHNAEQQQKINEAEQARQEQMRSEREKSLELQKEELRLGEERVAAQARLVTATREQVAAARQNYEQDKQTVAAAHQALRASSAGQRHILKQIEAKRKSGGKAEQWEIQQGLQAPVGTKLHDWALQQAEANDDTGLEMSPDVKGSKQKLDDLKAAQEKEEPGLVDGIKDQTGGNTHMATLVEKLTENARKQEELAAEGAAALERANKRLEEEIRFLKRYFK